jgi:protein-tyrosine kinase
MTIIERALNKHRPAAETARRQRTGTPQSKPIDPSLRLERTPATINRNLCRERRVLLSAETDREKTYVAAYRMLRTRLVQKARAGNWTTIAVTSASPNDGKTLTVINLAVSLAREKTREVVLLDMDMRNPSVFRALGIHPRHELREYLENGDSPHELFISVGENLLVAGSVTPTEHASELLAGARFDELMSIIERGTVDPIVLIDLPPVLVTDDALVVAPKVDSVLVVASEGLTNRADLLKALHLLSEFPLAGIVLNRAAETSPDYNYGYEADSKPGASGKTI